MRFDERDIYRLRDVFEIPEETRCYNGMLFDKEEIFMYFLKEISISL